MKRGISLFVSILLSCVMFPSFAVRLIDGLYYNLDNKEFTAQVTYMSPDKNGDYVSGDLVIPETVTDLNQTYTVTSIGKKAFYGCENLTSVKLPPTIKSSGLLAFAACDNLKRVDITDLEAWCSINYEISSGYFPGNPLVNGAGLFLNGEQITTLEFPETFDAVLPGTFVGCGGLKKVILPPSVTSIGASAFSFCSDLETVEFQGPVTELGDEAFADCVAIKDIQLPETLVSIGKNCFFICYRLESIKIPSSVRTIKSSAFVHCDALNAVHIDDLEAWMKIDFEGYFANPLYVAHHLYLNGNELKEVVVPPSITEIKDQAFYSCYSLEKIVLHDAITSIGSFAFCNCIGLKDVAIPSSVESIDSYAFCDIPGLEYMYIGSGITYIGSTALSKTKVESPLYLYITAMKAPEYPEHSKTIYGDDLRDPWWYGGALYIPAPAYEAYRTLSFTYYGERKTFELLTDFSASVDNIEGSSGKVVEFDVNFTPSFTPLEKIWISGYDPEIVKVDWDIDSKHIKINILDDTRGTDIIIKNLYPTCNSITIPVNGGSDSKVEGIYSDNKSKEAHIYNLQGVCLKRNASQSDIDALPPGIYIIGGKKMIIR